MKKPRKPVSGKTWKKAATAVCSYACVSLLLFFSWCGAFLIDQNGYLESKEDFRSHIASDAAMDRVWLLYSTYESFQDDPFMMNLHGEGILKNSNVVGAQIIEQDSEKPCWTYGETEETDQVYMFHNIWEYGEGKSPCEVRLYILRDLPVMDVMGIRVRVAGLLHDLRYVIPVLILALAGLFVCCLKYLIRSAGHRAGREGIVPYWGTKIPGDLFLGGLWLGCVFVLAMSTEGWIGGLNRAVLLSVVYFLGLWSVLDLSVRIKCKSLWNHLLIVKVGRYLWDELCKLLLQLREMIQNLPMVPKTAGIYTLISVFLLLITLYYHYTSMHMNLEIKLLLWGLLNLIVFPMVIRRALQMKKLQMAAKALAEGDLSYQVDTSKMLPDLREQGEDLNHIGAGMSAAVEQRVQSERMKTELITNVSHDLKTPLTSIINYSDLIGREDCNNPQITEYAEILHRQSERLKRLIEDLVEASKASTGNLEVNLSPCEVGVMLTQMVGEYEEKMLAAGLDLITTKPETPVTILADGRRLSRVFDNLLTNIYKYGQSGTRVYLTLERQEGKAVITFRNTSREPLNLSAEELMERFVRGDRSRRTEGNGLGLSIAKSLTELQKGTMELCVDGDLFKVVLAFPISE